MELYLYKLTQERRSNYDTFDAAIVCAADVRSAKLMHPAGGVNDDGASDGVYYRYSWAVPEEVTAVCIGVADPSQGAGVVLASFNAG